MFAWPSRRRALPPPSRRAALRSAGVTGHAPTGQRAGSDPTTGQGVRPGQRSLRLGTMKQDLLDLGLEEEAPFTMACGEQPQQRVEHFGANALSDTELVAMLLQGHGMAAGWAVAQAGRLIAEVGSLRGLASWEAVDYRRIKGIGPMKGAQLAAIAEIARRMMRSGEPRPLLNRPELIAAHLRAVATGLAVEKFWVLCLDRKNRLIRQVEITSGTATATLAHPREVFRAAVRESAAAIACAHNHPSGDPAPSAADMQVTKILREGAKAVDIELIDHVVIGRPECDPLGVGHYSFRSAGIL